MFVFTSCTNNYIPKARVLASTLKSFHPDWTFCLLLGEAPPQGFDLAEEAFDRLVGFDQLGIPGYKSWLFRHRVVEICTAAKGPALHHFLVREGHEKVMYLDPDIMVCNSLEPLKELLDEHDLLLTPHQLAPQETVRSIEDNEICSLQHGIFNLGFAAAARRGDGPRFARWWRDRLFFYCYDDIPRGIFTDQRWCDLAPAFFPNLRVVRDPGCNAASWNLTDRFISRAPDGSFKANDGPLRFYHFTGFDSGAGDGMTARYAKNMPAVHELWKIYRERLAASGQAALGKLAWAGMRFEDGTPISDDMRIVYRNREDLQRHFPDPFVRPGYLEWYRKNGGSGRGCFRNVKSILRGVADTLNKHGGFPRGLPGFTRQVLEWTRRWGVLGLARRVWNKVQDPAQPKIEVLQPVLPLLREALEQPESAAAKRFFALFAGAGEPVCVIEHDWGGGATYYCQKRVDSLLQEGRAVIRVRYALDLERLVLTALRGEESLRYEISGLAELADSRFPRIGELIVNELAGWHYDGYDPSGACARVIGAVEDLALVARRHEARVEFLFHDYFPVCPTVNLLTPENVYCGLPENIEGCDVCALRGKPFSMRKWREAWAGLLDRADEIVFFSENTRHAVRGAYALREEQIRVRPHKAESPGPALTIPADGPMRAAVVGNIQIHKGAGQVLELAKLMEKHDPEASLIVFGTLDSPETPRNVVVLGPYKHNELRSLLVKHQATVGVFPSIWPETFSFVIHELALLGLPQAAFPIGAQGDYLKSLPNSRTAKDLSAEALFEAVKELDAVRRAARPSP